MIDDEEREILEADLRIEAESILKDKAESDLEESGCAPLIVEVVALEHVKVEETSRCDIQQTIEAVVLCDDDVRRRIVYTSESDAQGLYLEDELEWIEELD